MACRNSRRPGSCRPFLSLFDCGLGSAAERGQLAGGRPRMAGASVAVHSGLFGDAGKDPHVPGQAFSAAVTVAPEEIGESSRQTPRDIAAAMFDPVENAVPCSPNGRTAPTNTFAGIRSSPTPCTPLSSSRPIRSRT